ncbi:hypothetical protein BGX24_008249, partial [Mortierella sp. AD032]
DIIGIGADYYQHAVTAIVAMKETEMLEPMEPEDSSPSSHDIITKLLQQLYFHKAHQQQPRQSTNEDHTNFTQHPSSEGTSGFDPPSANGMDLDTNINFDTGSIASSTSTQHGSKKVSQGTRKRKISLK